MSNTCTQINLGAEYIDSKYVNKNVLSMLVLHEILSRVSTTPTEVKVDSLSSPRTSYESLSSQSPFMAGHLQLLWNFSSFMIMF